MLIAIFGRSPHLSLAELEAQIGYSKLTPLDDMACLIDADSLDIDRLGGTIKIAKLLTKLPRQDKASNNLKTIVDFTTKANLFPTTGKITLGISWYRQPSIHAKQSTRLGLEFKRWAKKQGQSLRLVPNQTPDLSSATCWHNNLLKPNKIELILVETEQFFYLGQTVALQDIFAYSKRDRERPKRDAFTGMLPPKLAQIMINLTGQKPRNSTILDPFCGMGTVAQEANLLGFNSLGSDLNPKMIDFSNANLNWLHRQKNLQLSANYYFEVGDATTHQWNKPFQAIVSELWLGRPLDKPASAAVFQQQSSLVEQVLIGFLNNLRTQIPPGTPLVLAVPAWADQNYANYRKLPLLDQPENLTKLGYKFSKRNFTRTTNLFYHRPDQAVARQLLILESI